MSADDFAKAVNARDEYAESLARNTKRSDINKLISDYCAKNDIIAPSPYLSDKACLEYLFSVVDLKRGHREAVGKQMVEDYKLSLKNYILTDIQESIYCHHGLETKSVEELITWLIKMARLPKTSEFESFLRDFKEL
jgi:hypothetical protein